jgi:3',5'-cyclic AMP phosphodiesterase CpdA
VRLEPLTVVLDLLSENGDFTLPAPLKMKVPWFIYAVMKFVKPEPARAAFTLIHISDFHLCCTTGAGFARFLNKRALSYVSWKLRRQQEQRVEILSALIQALRAEPFDHLVMTGDLTHLGLPAEFKQARRHLQSIGPPEKVFAVPGNHDALVAAAWNEGCDYVSDFMASDVAEGWTKTVFPSLRVRGLVALIGVSSAHPTPILSAGGRIGAQQLQRLAELLQETARRELFRVLLIHHPPLPGMVSLRKQLSDAEAFGSITRRHGAELILHGHSHSCSYAEMDGPSGKIPVLGISSACSAARRPPRRAAFRRIRITSSPTGWAGDIKEYVYSDRTHTFLAAASTPHNWSTDRGERVASDGLTDEVGSYREKLACQRLVESKKKEQ